MKKSKALFNAFLTLIFCLCYILVVLSMSLLFNKLKVKTASAEISNRVVIIDAGHGGADGGAVSKDGVIEKNINLEIALLLKEELEGKGINVIMTRETDTELNSDELLVKGTRKQNDLRSRLLIGEQNENAIFISIHQNSFPNEKYKGLHVYYSKNNPSSAKLAQTVQQNIKTLQEDNQRNIKCASSSIFLLYNLGNPSILIECGFLSNGEECNKLQDANYQKELSSNIASSIEEYFLKLGT